MSGAGQAPHESRNSDEPDASPPIMSTLATEHTCVRLPVSYFACPSVFTSTDRRREELGAAEYPRARPERSQLPEQRRQLLVMVEIMGGCNRARHHAGRVPARLLERCRPVPDYFDCVQRVQSIGKDVLHPLIVRKQRHSREVRDYSDVRGQPVHLVCSGSVRPLEPVELREGAGASVDVRKVIQLFTRVDDWKRQVLPRIRQT